MPDKIDLPFALKKEVIHLQQLSGPERLSHLYKLVKMVVLHSPKKANELINQNLPLIETTRSEEAATLLGGKTLLCILQKSLSEAEDFAKRTLALSRDVGSDTAESLALFTMGLIADTKGEHKKAIAWHMKALDRCPDFLKPGILLALGAIFNHQGDYDRALQYLKDSIRQAETLMKGKTLLFLFHKEDKVIPIAIQAEAWSLLGTVNTGIGDFEEAQKNFDRAMQLAEEHQLSLEICMTLLRRTRLLLMIENFPAAETCLKTVEKLSAREIVSTLRIYIDHDWVRYYRAIGNYPKALEKYAEMLYDKERSKEHVRYLMEQQVEFFEEILFGIWECVNEIGNTKQATVLKAAWSEYETTVSEAGIFKEIDKMARIEVVRDRIKNIFDKIFEEIAEKTQLFELIRYRDRNFKYFPTEKRFSYIDRMGEERYFGQSTSLVLKYFIEHQGRCITAKELKNVLDRERINIAVDSIRSCIFSLRTRHGFRSYIKRCKGGWQLRPEH